MTAHRPLLLVAAGCVAATSLGLVFGEGKAVALAAGLVLAAALATVTAREIHTARSRQPQPRAPNDEMPLRLRQIAEALQGFGLERSLPPLLVPIVAVRLGRRGIDMTREPQRARELLGDKLWEIVRPDRQPAAHRTGRNLTDDDLRAVIDRLEQL